jgi:PAS domain S-box-containing protein
VSEIQLNSLAKALEADRAAFRVLADAIPIFVWLAREDGTIVFLSEPMLGYLGLADERAAIRNFRSLVPAPDADNVLVMWQAARAGGTCFEAELRLRRAADETYRWFLVQGRPVRDAGGQIDYWIGTATDVDAQKRATENLQFVIDASELLASGTSIEQVCTQFAQLAVRRFADWCFVMLADPQERYKVYAVAHRDAARARHIEHYLDRYPVGESSRLDEFLRAGQPVVVPEISDEILRESARDDEHLQMMRGLGLRSAIVAPLVHAGEILGAVIMYSAESQRRFDVADAEVLNTLARRAAARIHAARVLDEEQRARHRLQFIGRASQAVYESFDLTTAFGNLTQIIVSEIGDMAAVFRLEEGQAARVVGAAHRDPASDDIVRSLIGIRVMHGDAEKRFVQSLACRRARSKKACGRIYPMRLRCWPRNRSLPCRCIRAVKCTARSSCITRTTGANISRKISSGSWKSDATRPSRWKTRTYSSASAGCPRRCKTRCCLRRFRKSKASHSTPCICRAQPKRRLAATGTTHFNWKTEPRS